MYTRHWRAPGQTWKSVPHPQLKVTLLSCLSDLSKDEKLAASCHDLSGYAETHGPLTRNWETAQHCWIRQDSVNFGSAIFRKGNSGPFHPPPFVSWIFEVWTTTMFIDSEPSLSGAKDSGRSVYIFRVSVKQKFPLVVLATGVVGLSSMFYISHIYIPSI